MKKDSKKQVKSALEVIKIKYKDKVTIPAEEKYEPIDIKSAYSIGSIFSNYQLSGNLTASIPMGKLIEIYGDEGTFKTLLLLMLYLDVQSKGKSVVHINGERRWNNYVAQVVGINLQKVLLVNAEDAEESFDIANDFLKNSKSTYKDFNIGMIGIDSLDALVPKAILQGAMGDSTMGIFARLVGKFCRKAVSLCEKSGITVSIVNQTRYKIGMFGGKTRPGGMALHFYAWINIELKTRSKDIVKKKDKLTGDSVQVGSYVSLEAKKSRQHPPFKKSKFYVEFGKPIDKYRDLVETCCAFGLMKKVKKSTVSYPNYKDGKTVSIKTFVKMIKKEKLYSKIMKQLQKRIDEVK
jgi:recombination protein RecA